MASSLGIRNNVKTVVKVSEPEFPAISFFFLSEKKLEHKSISHGRGIFQN